MYFNFKAQTHCFLVWDDGKDKRNQPVYQKENCGAPQIWLILGNNIPGDAGGNLFGNILYVG